MTQTPPLRDPLDRFRPLVEKLKSPRHRWLAYLVSAAILSVFVFFPRPYLARVQLLPQDSEAGGLTAVLGALGGGLQNFASLIGTHQTTDVYLLIGRSEGVLTEVVKKLNLVGRHGFRTADQAVDALSRKVHLHSLTGGVLEIETRDMDRAYALQLTQAFTIAISDQVAALSREQTAKKKTIILDRFHQASTDLGIAQAQMDQFRRSHNLGAPETQYGAAATQQVSLEAELQAKQVSLQTAERFATGQSLNVQALRSDISGLQSAIAQAKSHSGPNSVTSLASQSMEYLNLYRTERFQQALFDTYTQALEQVAVEDLVANADTNVEVIEEPHIVPKRQFNLAPIGALLFLALLIFYVELYIPYTRFGLRRPSRS